jgi:hypothetical protein
MLHVLLILCSVIDRHHEWKIRFREDCGQWMGRVRFTASFARTDWKKIFLCWEKALGQWETGRLGASRECSFVLIMSSLVVLINTSKICILNSRQNICMYWYLLVNGHDSSSRRILLPRPWHSLTWCTPSWLEWEWHSVLLWSGDTHFQVRLS